MGSQVWEPREKPYTITSPIFEEESQSPTVLGTLSDAAFHVRIEIKAMETLLMVCPRLPDG